MAEIIVILSIFFVVICALIGCGVCQTRNSYNSPPEEKQRNAAIGFFWLPLGVIYMYKAVTKFIIVEFNRDR